MQFGMEVPPACELEECTSCTAFPRIVLGLGFKFSSLACGLLGEIRLTWTPKVCKIIAFMAIIIGLGFYFY